METAQETNPLKRLRDEQMLSQRELAKLAGVAEATVFKIEKGQKARGFTLRKLAKALEVHPREFMDLKSDR